MKEQIKTKIIELFNENSDYTFPELISKLKKKGLNVKGSNALYLKKNLIIWENTTSDFNNAIVELQEENKLIMKPLSKQEAMIVHAYSGEIINLPFADRIEPYNTPHWVPTILKKVKF